VAEFEVAAKAGAEFSQPNVSRGLAYGDFDRDGDLDLLMTTNNGPAHLYSNDQLAGNQSIRIRRGERSQIVMPSATSVKVVSGRSSQSRVVKCRSSYLSQSELPLTFGVGNAKKSTD
jgi:enediyne biosynthesis protein E4